MHLCRKPECAGPDMHSSMGTHVTLPTPTFNLTRVPGICSVCHINHYVNTSTALCICCLTSHPEVTVYNTSSL